MPFKYFPVTITSDGRKVPLIKGWQQLATNDPEQIKIWQELYRDRLHYWGIPTGKITDILALDIDMKDGRDGLSTIQTRQLLLPNTVIQKTRSGGFHYLYRYPSDGRTYGNKVDFMPGLDIRGEGGFIVYYGADVNAQMAEAPSWILAETAKPIYDIGTSIRVVPEIAERIITTSLEAIREAPEGESNNTLNIESFRLGQLIASGSITKEFAESALLKAARERGKSEREALATIASGLAGGMQKPLTSPFATSEPKAAFPIPPASGPAMSLDARWTPSRLTKFNLLNTSKLRKPQLFEDWSTEDIHITTADGGTGKTTLKLFEAICLALGERFLGFDCKNQGRTLFITGEDTDEKLAAMLGAIIRQMGLFEDAPGHDEKIQCILDSILIKKDANLCLIVKDRQGFLHPNPDAMRKVLEAVADFKPKMIVFDPISSFWGSEAALNDMAKAVSRFMSDLVDHSHACVEMINHMGKVSSAQKDMTQFAGRGGTGLPSHARVSRVLRAIGEEEYEELTGEELGEKQTAMLCNVNKFSDGSSLYNRPFVILRNGFLFSRKNLTPAKAKDAEKSLSDLERIFGFVKEARAKDRYPTRPVIIGHFMTCGDPISEARVKRALDLLLYQGHMGERLKLVDNPDVTIKDKCLVITDMDGEEITTARS